MAQERGGTPFDDWLAEWQRLYGQFWSGLGQQAQTTSESDAYTVPDPARWSAYTSEMLRIMSESYARGLGAATQTPGATSPLSDSPDNPQLVNLLSQATLLWMNAGTRYTARLGEVYGRYWSAYSERLSRVSSGLSNAEEEQRVMLDASRAFLRELVELTYQEARLLQAEIDRLDGLTRREAAPANKSGHARRLVRAVD